MFRQIAIGVLGFVGGAVASYALAITMGWLTPEIADPARAACVVRETLADRFATFPPPAEGRVRVLVTRLDGDQEGLVTRRVTRVLESIGALDVNELCRTLRVPITGTREAQAKAAEAVARTWATARHAEVVVYGERDAADGVVRLAIAGPGHAGEHGLSTYDLGERVLVLPEALAGDLGSAVAAVVIAEAAPAWDTIERGRFLVETLIPTANRLEALLADPALPLSPAARGRLRTEYGNVALSLGTQTGERRWLEKAVAANRAALGDEPRETAPLDWAKIQNNLGTALRVLGTRNGDVDTLEEAVGAMRAALEERTRARDPDKWALTMTNLAAALRALGDTKPDANLLQESVDAYRATLEVRTKERMPFDWAVTQNNLGIALLALGLRRNDETLIEQARDAFLAALTEQTRERVPLNWAATQDNLGNTFRVLGVRRGDDALLGQAATAYRAALLERTREQVPLMWAQTTSNLALVWTAQGKRQRDRVLLEQAIQAQQDAIMVMLGLNATAYAENVTRALEEAKQALAALDKSGK